MIQRAVSMLTRYDVILFLALAIRLEIVATLLTLGRGQCKVGVSYLGEMQENFRVKALFWFCGFGERVPREVISWTMHKLGVACISRCKNGRQ